MLSQIRSVGYGWGVLIVAGAGSYYFAKKQINADREQRALQDEKRRQQLNRMKAQETVSREMALANEKVGGKAKVAGGDDDRPSPSREGGGDPAPVEHRDEAGSSRFEAKEPFRSRKGDRFS